MFKKILPILLIIISLISCQNVSKGDRISVFETSVNSLKKAYNIEHKENVLEWSVDTLNNGDLILKLKSTDENILKEAVKIASTLELKYEALLLTAGDSTEAP